MQGLFSCAWYSLNRLSTLQSKDPKSRKSAESMGPQLFPRMTPEGPYVRETHARVSQKSTTASPNKRYSGWEGGGYERRGCKMLVGCVHEQMGCANERGTDLRRCTHNLPIQGGQH